MDKYVHVTRIASFDNSFGAYSENLCHGSPAHSHGLINEYVWWIFTIFIEGRWWLHRPVCFLAHPNLHEKRHHITLNGEHLLPFLFDRHVFRREAKQWWQCYSSESIFRPHKWILHDLSTNRVLAGHTNVYQPVMINIQSGEPDLFEVDEI